MTNLSRHWLAMMSLPALASTALTPALAEEPMLDEVIVTAQYVKEDAQKTAISMEVLSSEKLEQAGIVNVADVAKITPGLQLEQPGGGLTAVVRIRGIGTPGVSPLDPSVPIFIDGVAQARTGSGFQDLLDISRIEVLRGPQGTLYGRNSTAGTINVWTKDANANKWEGSAEVEAGNYDRRSVKATVNAPLVDGILAARLSGYSVKQDGYITNGYTGETGNGYADRYGARAKIGFAPTSTLKAQWVTDYSESINHPLDSLIKTPYIYNCYAVSGATCNTPGVIVTPGGPVVSRVVSNPKLAGIPLNRYGLPIDDPYNGKVYRNFDATSLDKNFASSLKVDWDILDKLTLTSISAYSKYVTKQHLDLDHSILDYYETRGRTQTITKSQELRLAGDVGDHLNFVAGAYYSIDDVDSRNYTDSLRIDKVNAAYGYFVQLSGSPNLSYSVTDLEAEFRALFGQINYKVGPVTFTGGVRRTWVEKYGNTDVFLSSPDFTDPNFSLGPPVVYRGTPLTLGLTVLDNLTIKNANTSGVFKVRYFVTDDVTVYASYDLGYKPGGFNRLVSDPAVPLPKTYVEETSTNYEVGTKASWFDRRLQTNVSAFYLEFKNYQNQFITTSSDLIIENLKKVVSKGVEADVQVAIAKGLTLGAGFAYLDPRIKDSSKPNGTRSDIYKIPNERLVDVSQRSANVNVDYSHPITDAGAEGFMRVDWAWRSEYGIAEPDFVDNLGYKQSAYSLTGLRVGVRGLADHWQVSAWVKNLFDKEYAASGSGSMGGFSSGAEAFRFVINDGQFIVQGPPRTFGLSVKYDF